MPMGDGLVSPRGMVRSLEDWVAGEGWLGKGKPGRSLETLRWATMGNEEIAPEARLELR